MTATGALIARHVTDLFPTQTSRFDLAQAARRGVIAPLRCVRIPPGPGRAHDRQGAAAPRRGRHRVRPGDAGRAARPAAVQPRDRRPLQDALQRRARASSTPPACATPTTSPQAFRDVGHEGAGRLGRDAQARAGRDPRPLRARRRSTCWSTRSCWPRAGTRRARRSACTSRRPRPSASTSSASAASRAATRARRRASSSTSSIPATKHDDPVVTLHSLLDRDVYRGGAIVVGPVRRGRGRRLRVERRVLPVTADENRRIEVFERELWRIAVEHLDYGEQVQWAALAGARVAPTGWRRARAMLHFDQGGELKRTFLITAVERNKNPQLRLRALQEIAAGARRRGVRPRARLRRDVAARREARGREGRAAGAGREEDRPPRPGQQLDLALREHDARGARGVRRAALAGDQAAARPARELVRRRARAQRAPARARRAPAGPAAVRRAARRRARRTRAEAERGHQRRPHADVAQAGRARARAAAQLPEGQGQGRRGTRRRKKKGAARASRRRPRSRSPSRPGCWRTARRSRRPSASRSPSPTRR